MQQSSRRLTVRTPQVENDADEFGAEVRAGLTGEHKTLPCRFLYDRRGSELFEQICELPEYYVTRTEREILENNADAIAALFPEDLAMVELGSGSSSKTRVLIEAFLRSNGRLRYVPMDISKKMLVESSEALLEDYDGLKIVAIAAEYSTGLRQLGREAIERKLILWLGSTLGNFERKDSARFLARIKATMTGDDRLLVGIDLRKDKAVLEAAYDDAQGVTAKFNLNLLVRINSELGGNFDLRHFRHEASYEEESGRVRSNIVSLREQTVHIRELDMYVEFTAEERIHTENSHKYSLAEIDALAQASGLRVTQQWFDSDDRFALNLFAPA